MDSGGDVRAIILAAGYGTRAHRDQSNRLKATAIENHYGPVGVVYYRLMAAWAKERDLPPSVTLS